MSQSPLDETADTQNDGFANAQKELDRLVREGVKSWSGSERNCCFLNTGGGKFATVSAVAGLDFLDDSRALAKVDWDHDGDLDLIQTGRTAPQVRFLRNDADNDNHYLAIRLTGVNCNRDAIGARVEVYTNGNEHPQIQSLRAGSGFLSQSSKWLQFGLGTGSTIDQIVIKWPNGESESFSGAKVDGRYELVQGSGLAKAADHQERSIQLDESPFELPKATEQARIVCSDPILLPRLGVVQTAGKDTVDSIRKGKPILVSLWATWCQPCVHELQELANRKPEIDSAGIQVLAVSVDGMEAENPSPAIPESFLRDLEFPYEGALATPTMLEKLKRLRGDLFRKARSYSIPTSFLIDEDGKLAVIYQGAVDVDQLLKDVKLLDVSNETRRNHCFPIAGRWFTPPKEVSMSLLARSFAEIGFHQDAAIYRKSAEKQRANSLFNVGLEQLSNGQIPQAAQSFSNALKKDSSFALAHQYLGVALMQMGRVPQGEQALRDAIKLDAELKEAHYYLGVALTQQRKSKDAIPSYEKALELDANFSEAHMALGRLYHSIGKPTLGSKHLAIAKTLRTSITD